MRHTIFFVITGLILSGFTFFLLVTFRWKIVSKVYQGWAIHKRFPSSRGSFQRSLLRRHSRLALRRPSRTHASSEPPARTSFGRFQPTWVITRSYGIKIANLHQSANCRTNIAIKDHQLYIRTAILAWIRDVINKKKQKIWTFAMMVPRCRRRRMARNGFSSSIGRRRPMPRDRNPACPVGHQLPAGYARSKHNFRVAFYVSAGGTLKPFASFDILNQTANFLRAFREHESRFRGGLFA